MMTLLILLAVLNAFSFPICFLICLKLHGLTVAKLSRALEKRDDAEIVASYRKGKADGAMMCYDTMVKAISVKKKEAEGGEK